MGVVFERDPEAGRRLVVEALQETGGNVTRAAHRLGWVRGSLEYRIRRDDTLIAELARCRAAAQRRDP